MWCDEFFDEYCVVIAVNTAAWHYRCHWMVGGDRHIFDPVLKGQEYRLPLRGVVTNPVFGRLAQSLGLEWRRPPLQDKTTVASSCSAAPALVNNDVCAYSMPNALWLAYEFISQPTDLAIYGFDLAQTGTDFAGVKGDHGRNRWIQELYWLRDIWKPGIQVHGKASEAVRGYLDRSEARNPFLA